jgi:hypothetical protein
VTVDEALKREAISGIPNIDDFDVRAMQALAAEVRRQRAELELVNHELGALQYSAGNLLVMLRGGRVRSLQAFLARSLRNADRTGSKRK